MKSAKSGSQPFVVMGQTPESCCRGKTSLHHPAPWRQDEASFRPGVFHQLQLDAVLFGSLGRSSLDQVVR
jgi:hypothetical protein